MQREFRDVGTLDIAPSWHEVVDCTHATTAGCDVPTYEEARTAELFARVSALVEDATPSELRDLGSLIASAEATLVQMTHTSVPPAHAHERRPRARTRGVRRVRRVNRIRSGRSPDDSSGDPDPGPRYSQRFRGTGTRRGCR